MILDSLCYIEDNTNKFPKLDIEKTCNSQDCKLEYCINVKSDVKNIVNTDSYIEMVYNNIYKIDGISLEDFKNSLHQIELEKYKLSFEMYNKLVDSLNRQNMLCKTKIINTIEGDILEKYKLTILEDMIRNQYKRNHILLRYKKSVSTDRYRAYKPDEVIISHDSLIQASLWNYMRVLNKDILVVLRHLMKVT